MAHRPTEETREMVRNMVANGVPQGEIARVMGVAQNTLTKHYREEIDNAKIKANAMVVGKLYENCMAGKEASIFFWLKTQCNWREVTHIENRNVDKDGNDIHTGDWETLEKMGYKKPEIEESNEDGRTIN